ncbi:hypothetical protein S40293_08749 [Stachybotrys chartarum IBT 40293]|nr:hypothetical protein S40293_08749 [Stachybotrys chartarum IBT 40293]
MPSAVRDILIFAGQGSNQYLISPSIAKGLRQLLGEEQEVAFQGFLSRCKDAFHQELSSVTAEGQSILGDDIINAFQDPDSFLLTPESFQSHPVLETLNLYIFEILELVLLDCHEENHHVIETAGICTGILPAILAASFTSYNSKKFWNSAVEGFRLAFWTGLRASLYSRQVSGGVWRDKPSVLGVFGAKAEEVESRLLDQEQALTPNARLRISAIFSDSNVSVAGPGNSLEAFRDKLAADLIQARWANVHAIYHGGNDMAHVVEEVLGDSKRRNIQFPTWESLCIPVRSVSSGIRLNPDSESRSDTLLETALHSIFIDRVDWREAGSRLYQAAVNVLDGDSAAKLRIAGMGPGSRALVHALKHLPSHPRLERVDNFAASLSQPRPDDIAIVGLSVNYPDSKDQAAFWEVLEKGRSTVKEIPKSRFDMTECYPPEQPAQKKGGTAAKYGNFLEDPFAFDAAYFNISPREAKSIDPQQRLLLHGALEALEDAGYSPDSTKTFQRDTFGVYVGVATGDYVDNLRDDIDVYYSPGTLRAFLAGRISYAFKFKGPSMVIDTACSSSTVALYHAAVALRSGECSAALVGGVNVISSPDMFCGLGRAHFLSPTGQCKPFDQGADGYCRSEGCGVVVLKKLSDAVEEGDHIYGVIRGIKLNQCGTAKSITHPDHSTQAALVKTVLKTSRVTPDSINAIEAHGTGTQAGDFAELNSLSSIFGPRPPNDPLYLSSVKGHVGHSEAASGIAGLAKLLLMMEKKKIPPQASHSSLNPRLESLVTGRFHIPTQLLDWQKTGSDGFIRRALLNNFGASGSNAALVVEEYAPRGGPRERQLVSSAQSARSHNVVNLSAKSESALKLQIAKMLSFLDANPTIALDDLAYSANSRRIQYSPWRLSTVASSIADLQQQLRQDPRLVKVDTTSKQKVVFAFSGQGAVNAGMGADLLSTVPLFQAIVDECDRILSENGFPAVKTFLKSKSSQLDDVVVSQVACFVLEFALANTWLSWGLQPDLVVGHSIGEFAAFAFAGALSLHEALLLVARRARLMAKKCAAETTGMLVCRIPAPELAKLLEERTDEFDGVAVTCMNSSQDLVVGGPVESLKKLGDHLKGEGFKAKLLPVPYGFHSAAMDPILDDLKDLTDNIRSTTPVIRLGSSLHGRVLDNDEGLAQDYFVHHARRPVNFTGLVEDISKWAAGSKLSIVEIGPSPSTDPMFKQTLSNTDYTFLASLRPNQGSWATLASALRSLFQQNIPIQWKSVYDGSTKTYVKSLAGYAITPASYFIRFKPSTEKRVQNHVAVPEEKEPRYAFLDGKPELDSNSSKIFTTRMNQISPFIKAHNVGGSPLCPASVYMEIVLQAAAQQGSIDSQTSMCVFEHVNFGSPLVCGAGHESSASPAVKTHFTAIDSTEILQFSSESSSGQVLCSGRLRNPAKTQAGVPDLLSRKSILGQRLKRSFSQNRGSFAETFTSRTIYDIIFPRVVQYTQPYLTLKHLVLDDSGLEGHGIFTLAPLNTESDELFVSMPTFVDTLLHAAGFVANTHANPDTACICVKLEQAMVPSDSTNLYGQELQVYCTIGDIGHSFIADAYAYDQNGQLVAYVEGMCFKKMKLKSFQSHLARLVGRSPAPVPVVTQSTATVKPSAPRGRPTTKDNSAIPRRTAVEAEISKVGALLRRVCGLDEAPAPSKTLEELGMDSLLLIEFGDMLRSQLRHVEIARSDVENCETVGDLIKLIIESSNQFDASSTSDGSPSPSSSSTEDAAPPRTGSLTPPTPQVAGENSLIPLLKPLFVQICGMDPTNDYDGPLSSLGVDSLLSIELIHEIRGQLGIEIDPHQEDISELSYKQLEELCVAKAVKKKTQHLSKQGNESHRRPTEDNAGAAKIESANNANGSCSNFPRTLQTAPGVDSHLYLFHDGSGLCSMYSRLSSLERNVYGVSSLELPQLQAEGNAGVQTLEDLAAFYIQNTGMTTKSNIVLGGWSFGGVLASEVARQLSKTGKAVQGIILVDSPAPVDHIALPAEVISYVLGKGSDSGGKRVETSAAKDARAKIGAQFARHASMLQNYHPDRVEPRSRLANIPCVILRCLKTIDTEKLCGVTYPWLGDLKAGDQSIKLWEELLGRDIPVLELDCNHFEVFEGENIKAASKQLRVACDLLQH